MNDRVKLRPLLTLILVALPVCGFADTPLPPEVLKSLSLRKAPESSLSVYVENLDTGEPLLRWNETVPRNPASVVKIVTTMVALDILGPAYTWKTEVYSVGEIKGNVLDGDLLLKGYGDPHR